MGAYKQLKILGCGGHCKVVLDALSLIDHSLQISLCESNKDLLGKELMGIVIDSTSESLESFTGYVHLAIGNNQVRKNIVDGSLNSLWKLFTVIHPAAIIAKSAFIGEGSLIAAGAILGPDSVVGRSCIVNHAAIVDHEVEVGDFSHIAPNSTLGGQVKIGKGVLVGAGSVILPGVTVGDGAIVAAGAVVVKNVKENTIVKGIPAKL